MRNYSLYLEKYVSMQKYTISMLAAMTRYMSSNAWSEEFHREH